jgi:hypothetical protein
MPKVEIDETELKTYQQVFNAVRQGLSNPKTRTKLLEVQAELTPEAASPEVTLHSTLSTFRAELTEELGKFRDEVAKDKSDREERETRDRLGKQWAEGKALARSQGYTAEGLEKLEKFMEDNGIASHRHAIPSFEKENPPPQPVSTGGQRWDFFGSKESRPPDMEALLRGDEDAFLGPAIADALSAVRGQK